MDWSILGIEPTFDKKEITRAYRSRLVHTNPEDKPEEFKVLRAAYEQALAEAARAQSAAEAADASVDGAAATDAAATDAAATDAAATDAAATDAGNAGGFSREPRRPKTPEEQWFAQFTGIYADFQKRIDPACWRELLGQDVAIALDSRPQIEMMLLVFLLQNGNLPQEIWQLLEDTFKWSQRKDELYENYPRAFVDHLLIDGAKYPPVLPFSLFSPGENAGDCDAYLDFYLQAEHCEWQEASEFLDKMEALSETHPYGRALRYHLMAAQGNGLGVVKLLELLREFPNERRLKEELAETYADGESWERCESIVRDLLASDGDDRRLMWLLAQALAGQQRFSEGVELLGDLMHAAGGDQKELQELSDIRKRWNESLIEQYEERLEQGDCSDKLLFELSWCYLQNERDQESVELLGRIDRGNIEPYEYYNLSSQAYLATKRFDQAFEDSKVLVEIVRTMQPDGTARTAKRMARLAEMIARCGDALYAQEKIEEALPYYQEAAKVDPDNPERLTHYSRIMASLNRWPEAAKAASRLIEVMPGAYHAHCLLAQYCFEMRNDRDAFYQVNYALGLEKGDLGVYVLRLRILLRNGAVQQAADDLRFLEDSQCGEYLPVLWCKALYAEATDSADLPNEGVLRDGAPFVLKHGRAAARQIYRSIYDRLTQGEEMDWPGQVCFRLALLSQDEECISPDDQLAFLNKGLELDPNDRDRLSLKAWILQHVGRTDEAICAYEQLIKLPHDNKDAEHALAQLYAKDADRNADKAFAYYRSVLEQRPDDPVLLRYAGLYAYYAHEFRLAEGYFLQERTIEPDCPDSYRLLSFVYEAQERYDDALRECESLLRITTETRRLEMVHHLRKVHVLRRMGHAQEALESLRQTAKAFSIPNIFGDVSEILLQFGMFDEHECHLDAWAQAAATCDQTIVDSGELVHARVYQELLGKGNVRHARHFAQVGNAHMSEDQRFDAQRVLAQYAAEYSRLERMLAERVKQRRLQGASVFRELSDLAMTKWLQGNSTAAVQYAQEAFQEIESVKTPFGMNARYLVGLQSVMLALLGRFEQAQDALEAMSCEPRCERCACHGCADRAFFQAWVYLIGEKEATCCELVRQGRKRWPGDAGFACLEQELKWRGVF